jgi:hypothetical protein
MKIQDFYVQKLILQEGKIEQHIYIRIKQNQESYLIQGDSRLVDITAGGDFLGLSDQKKVI